MAGGDAPRGYAVEQVEFDVHEAGEGQAAAEPVFRIIAFDAEGLRVVGLRITTGDEAGDASPEGVRLALLPDEPGGEKGGLQRGKFGNCVGFYDGARGVLRMEGFDDAYAVLLPASPGFADAAVIEFDGGVRGAVPCEEPDRLAEAANTLILQNSHSLYPAVKMLKTVGDAVPIAEPLDERVFPPF